MKENMLPLVWVVVTMAVLSVEGQKTQNQYCKDPTVVHRFMADDVRFASPFYVIALPRTPKTEQIDNVCYTYFETVGAFFHIISVVHKNGSNAYYTFSKSDLVDRVGLAEGIAEKTSPCVYHDYTLTPICNVTVFVLYRCFIDGECDDIDIGRTKGVDVRVVLSATPHVSDTCRLETEANLKDTSSLAGGDYVILSQKLKPQCVTSYNGMKSINAENAVGSLELTKEDIMSRFGENSYNLEFSGTTSASIKNSTNKLPEATADLPTMKDEYSKDLVFSGTTIGMPIKNSVSQSQIATELPNTNENKSNDLLFSGTAASNHNSNPTEVLGTRKESTSGMITKETVSTSSQQVVTPLLSALPTPQSKEPKKTYAEAVKTVSKPRKNIALIGLV